MRLTLIDLIIATVLAGIGAIAGNIIWGPDVPAAVVFLCGFVSIMIFASPIYRLLHYRPLWLPACPHCNDRPGQYQIIGRDSSSETVVCPLCSQSFRVIYTRKSAQKNDESGLKGVIASWPYFWGRYTKQK